MDKYFDLGSYTRPVTTTVAEAQVWFDRGLAWVYGYNFEEAAVSFQKAAHLDPTCAMAQWGIAYASGPFINKPWSFYGEQERIDTIATCHQAAQKAKSLSHNASATEQALIEAVQHRYPSKHAGDDKSCADWNDAYADAMRKVYKLFPDDLDVITLFAESMMLRTPWKLWNIGTGKPAEKASTLEMMAVLEHGQQVVEEKGLAPHAGLLHTYIHTIEMSPFPERALNAADKLRGLVSESGHLCHMPSHIYVLCGHYYDAITVNQKAVAADKKYLAHIGPYTYYTSECCHDLHMLMYAAMLSGQFQPALAASDAIVDLLTEDVLRSEQAQLASTLEGYYSMRMHVFVRFGKWQEIVDQPLPDNSPLYCVTTTMAHYARGIAYAALGKFEDAERERTQFYAAWAKVPETRYFFNNYASEILRVAEAMLNGEVEYHKGNYAIAFEHLREAVKRSDNLGYSEPWPWMHPPRHALAALLLAQGHIEEAEAVYRADLGFDMRLNRSARHLNNVWSLHGYVECLRKQNKVAELALMEPPLTLALARTDVPILASCCCRLDAVCCG